MRDGARLYYRHWLVPSPRGVVVLIHGIQSHSLWYGGTCARLAAAGYDTAFLDRRGSGLNRAQRGDAPERWTFADDLGEFVDDARRRLPGKPVHLVAISWGAKLATAACIRRPGLVESLILMGPALASKVDVPFGDKLRTALALVTNPRRLFDVPLADARLFTDNPERIAFIERDPLSLRKVTARFLYETRRLDRFVRGRANEMRLPVLTMLAGRDRIVDNDATRKLFDRFASTDKQIVEYPDAAHTIEFELDPEPMRRDLIAWLNERTGTRGG
jgi:alpha-beta hydrolase superfamily lysophospholipase